MSAEYEFAHTLRNGLDVTVEYRLDEDGYAVVTSVCPRVMPMCLVDVDADEAEEIGVIAIERAFFGAAEQGAY